MDKLYPTSVAGEILGLRPDDVLVLVRRGKLKAKRQVVRGSGKMPRLYVLQSSLQRYIEGLDDGADPMPQGEVRIPEKKTRMPVGLRAEISNVRQYF